LPFIVPSTIVIPRDGSFALALFGSLMTVHELIVDEIAVQRIIDILILHAHTLY